MDAFQTEPPGAGGRSSGPVPSWAGPLLQALPASFTAVRVCEEPQCQEVNGSNDVMYVCDDGVSLPLKRGGRPTACDRQLDLEGMMPPEIGQRQYCVV